MSCGVGHRHGSDPVLLCLWHRVAAIAPTGPLAWEPPYSVGAAPKNKKQKIQTDNSKQGDEISNQKSPKK